jgi:putative acetyltransferase
MHVRRAGVEDRGPLLELWERSVRATHHFLGEGDLDELRPLVAEALASDALGWWVLEAGGETRVGFLGVAGDSIEALFIEPAHHRQGAGRLLVAHAQSLVGGALRVDVNEQNPGALRFYEALGFSVVGRSPMDSGGRPFPILPMKRRAPGSQRPGAPG